LFKDAHAYSCSYDTFQKSVEREKRAVVSLHPIVVEETLGQWGIDIIGEINPHSSKKHTYILTANDYFTCFTEAIPLTKVNDEVVTIFLEQHIITKFGVPNSHVFDNATFFFTSIG
jgi:hypothetical protein